MRFIPKFIPKFMRTSNWMMIGIFSSSSLVYMTYKMRLDAKFNNPLIEESLKLIENNIDVAEQIGVPLHIVSSIRNMASLSPDIQNYFFKVKGPRGMVSVELAASSRRLDQLGLNSSAKKEKKDKDEIVEESITEFNYNDYYIPDKSIVSSYKIFKDDYKSGKKIDENAPFWKIEYLYAESKENIRVMVAPLSATERKDKPIFKRETFDDIASEYFDRKTVWKNFRQLSSKEEEEELRKYNLQLMYKGMAYKRFYMLFGMAIILMNLYIVFRKRKRFPLVNGTLHKTVKNKISGNKIIQKKFGDSLYFIEHTVGAKIENEAEFELNFVGDEIRGIAKIDAIFDENTIEWTITDLDVQLFDVAGDLVQEDIKFDLA